MQQRPDARIREAFIVRLGFLFAEKNRKAALFRNQGTLDFLPSYRFAKRSTRPANFTAIP